MHAQEGKGVSGRFNLGRLVHEYEQSNEQLHREIEQKQERIWRLEKDPRELDIKIHQLLKLAGPGEKILIIDD